MTIRVHKEGAVTIVTIDRLEARNAVNPEMADALFRAFIDFDRDGDAQVAILTGVTGAFCAGFDLKATASRNLGDSWFADHDLDASFDGSNDRPRKGPMGPTRLTLSKPVIAAVEGHAVAGGLELAVWCDLRVAASDAVFGVYCRRWGVPLIDGGTIRLPRLIGHSHAMDLILTGRGVSGDEARAMGLANRIVAPGEALAAAVELGHQLAAFPQRCLRSDRRSSYDQWSLDLDDALARETQLGLDVIRSGETQAGATRFADGAGRHGTFT